MSECVGLQVGGELTERHQARYRYRARWRASAGLLEVKLVCANRDAIVVIVAVSGFGRQSIVRRDQIREYSPTVTFFARDVAFAAPSLRSSKRLRLTSSCQK